MNTTSDKLPARTIRAVSRRMTRILAPLAALVVAIAVAGCIPGPWDYKPEARPVFRGITVFGYIVADRPLEHLCFEKLLTLDEAAAEAFAFYDSADVTITGAFAGGGPTLTLAPDTNVPNCFKGPATTRFMRGEAYDLRARFVWDSAGVRAVTTLTATARIPGTFAIADTAWAPSLAQLGVALGNVTDPSVFNQLPPVPRARFLALYGDTLTAMAGDSAALSAWYAVHGARMQADLLEWLSKDQIPYSRGDSLFYLSRPAAFNNLSHYFRSHRDDRVEGVLITHRFDTTGARPGTAFDSIFVTPDSADFYFSGNIRRLAFYNTFRLPDGKNNLDTMSVFNLWFWSRVNRLYFYGVEDIYARYQAAIAEASGNPKIRLPSNINGGAGFFAGMVVDSFDVHIKLDTTTQAFSYAATRAAACRDKGWFDTRDCVGYYPEYCAQNAWTAPDCRLDVLYRAFDDDSLTLPAALRDSARTWSSRDPVLGEEAARRYCIAHDYPAGVSACAPVQAECENDQSGNGCQILLWKHCQLSYWNPDACREGLKSYCRARRDVHQVMCRDVPEN